MAIFSEEYLNKRKEYKKLKKLVKHLKREMNRQLLYIRKRRLGRK